MKHIDCDIAAFELALRVLSTWNQHRQPKPADLKALRESFPGLTHFPPDEMACHVINELTPRIRREPASARTIHTVPESGRAFRKRASEK
jgi:hypothetical protein